jgi:hypothetical protein
MARPSATACTRATFTDDVGCLRVFNLQQRKALLVYFNVLELAALGGEDYTNQLGPDGSLVQDSKCDATLDPEAKQLAALLINQNNASDAGADVPTDPNELMAAIACLQNQPPNMLDAMALHLQCLLGRHAAYPQEDL